MKFQAVCFSRSSSSSSSKLFVCLFLVLVLVPSVISEKLPNRMGFVISSHMSHAWSNGALNYCIRRVSLGKPQHGSMEALIFHRNITKTLPFRRIWPVLSSICVVLVLVLVPSCYNLCSSSSSSSSKLFVCLVVVLVLALSSLFIYFWL